MSAKFAKIAAICAVFSLFGCSSDAGGPVKVTAGVSVTDASGAGGLVACVRVPVLLGSVVLQQRQIPNAFDVELRALRHEVDIEFPGARNEAQVARSVRGTSLSAGHSESLAVIGRDGNTYTAVVVSGCSVIVDGDEDP